MKSISLVFLAAGLALGLAHNARADDGLDVTMQVLDDVSGIDGVLLSVGDGADAGEHPAEHGNESADAAGREHHVTGDGGDDTPEIVAGHDDDLASGLDEHSEGHVEDSDVAHEPPAEDVPSDGGTTADTVH